MYRLGPRDSFNLKVSATKVWHDETVPGEPMAIKKIDVGAKRHDDVGSHSAGGKLPPNEHSYDSDVTCEVTKRIQAAADKVLASDEWKVLDEVGKR
jgi:hypothetical protein